VLLLVLLTFAWWFWQPLHVLERTQNRLEKQVERRNWDNVAALLAENYSDDYGHSKQAAIEAGSEILRHFFFLDIVGEGEREVTSKEKPTAEVRQRLLLQGSGSAFASMIIERANERQGRFIFTWEREPGWPPSWKLRHLSHESGSNW
jgi:hypothetical protein